MQTNTARTRLRTHEGGTARHIQPLAQLRRSVLACMLFEREFYEDGQDIATRIASLTAECDPNDAAALALEARTDMNLRHVPLLIVACLAYQRAINGHDIAAVIQRPDEMGELLAMVAKLNGVGPDRVKKVLSNQMKEGLAQAFVKFDRYQLAKYNRPKAITLRDVMFMVHPKPRNDEQETAFKALAEGNMTPPDTWEARLTAGEDKRQVFTDLLARRKLGYMAVLRNLRNMVQAGVERDLIASVIRERKGAERVLPFRFVAAAKACPQLEPELDAALVESIRQSEPLPGRTIVLVDVSASMDMAYISCKSDMTRMIAAATLASMVNGDSVRVFTFSDGRERFASGRARQKVTVEVPPRQGMAGVDAIIQSQAHMGTLLGRAVKEVNALPHDRLIVITDEQTADRVPDPVCERPYIINVASARNGVGYGRWIHIDGFSESVLRYINEVEREAIARSSD